MQVGWRDERQQVAIAAEVVQLLQERTEAQGGIDDVGRQLEVEVDGALAGLRRLQELLGLGGRERSVPPAELVTQGSEPGRCGVGGVGVLDERELAPPRLLVLAGPTVDLHRQADEAHGRQARAVGRHDASARSKSNHTTLPASVGRVPQRTARSSRMRRPRPVLAIVECG